MDVITTYGYALGGLSAPGPFHSQEFGQRRRTSGLFETPSLVACHPMATPGHHCDAETQPGWLCESDELHPEECRDISCRSRVFPEGRAKDDISSFASRDDGPKPVAVEGIFG